MNVLHELQRAENLWLNYPSSVQVPDWTLQQDRQAMTHLGITGALLSQPNSGTSEQVRQLNTFLAEASREDPQQYGFLANLPFLVHN